MTDKEFIKKLNLKNEERASKKTKQSPSSNDGLGNTTLDSDKLIDATKIIIGNTPDPVKLITAQIQYCRLVEKMYRNHRRVK